MDRDLLTLDEVAELYPWPKKRLYGWRYARQGPPAVRIGKRVYYSRAKIDAWIADQMASQAAE